MAAQRHTSTSNSKKAPPVTTVIMVRHGQTPTTGAVLPGRSPNLHLGDTGIAQAEQAAERIAELTIAAVYASPMERTQETAKPIAKATKNRIRTRAGLNECDFGDWTGKKLDALRKKPEWATVQSAPSQFRFPGGESFAEMQHRFVSEVDALATDHRGETIVVVSHADCIKAGLAWYAGTPLDLFQRIVVSPCSLSIVMLGTGAPIVLTQNSTAGSLTKLGVS